MRIEGDVEPGFERVRDAFAANFERADAYREVGAALAVYRAGRPVVDLSAGHRDRARTRPWTRDTLINVYSTTKGVVAAAMAIAVERGLCDYGDRVARHWPEFGATGKEEATIAQVLSHQVGLPGFREPTTIDDLFDWQRSCAVLARQAPSWKPGSETSYHALTYGFLAGEVLRRASSRTIGRFVAEEIAAPLRADVYIGLPAAEETRVAEMIGPREPVDMSKVTVPELALPALVNPQLDPEVPNRRAWRAAEIPAANGQATADGIARLYAALANRGTLDGARILSPAAVARMTERQSARRDLLLGAENNWSLGVTMNFMSLLGPDPQTFGHGGWGGSFGCANIEANVAIGYVCNQMGGDLVGDPRAAGLCATIFDCLKR